MRKIKLFGVVLISIVLFGTITSCSGKLEPTEAKKVINKHLENKGKVILGFEFSIYEKNGLYHSKDYSLNPKSWMGHASKLGLISVKTSIQKSRQRAYPDYGIINAKLTKKAEKLVVSQRKISGSFGKKILKAKVLTGQWEVSNSFVDVFETGNNKYKVNIEEIFKGNVFSEYYFHNGFKNTQGGNPIQNGEKRKKTYVLLKNSNGDWKVQN